MSETTGISGNSSSGSTPISTTTSSSTATITGGTAGGSGDINNQTVTSLEDLKTKSPELYKAMIEGIAQNMCRKMQKNQERIKKLMREGKS